MCATSSAQAPTSVSVAGPARGALERAQQDGQALAFDGLADEQYPQRRDVPPGTAASTKAA